MALTKRTATGRQCWVRVKTRLGGIESERRVTNDQYAALRTTKGMSHLALPGEIVLHAYEEIAYDTFTGKLGDDEYGDATVAGDGSVISIKEAGKRQVSIPLVNGTAPSIPAELRGKVLFVPHALTAEGRIVVDTLQAWAD